MNETKSAGGGAFKITPGSPAWDAWLAFYRGSGMAKIEARMLGVLANAKRARQQWLRPLLLEIMSSDCPLEDVEIVDHPNARTVIEIRGAPAHVLEFDLSFVVPGEMPPELPRRDLLTPERPPAEPIEPGARVAQTASGLEYDHATLFSYRKLEATNAAESAEQIKRRKLERTRERLLGDALAAVSENRRPELGDCDDFDVVAVVDPNEAESLVLVGKGAAMRIKNIRPQMRLRVVALRDDPIGQLAKRGQLGKGQIRDDRLAAARCWQAYYEKAEIGGARAIVMHERVDGGGFVMPETDQQMRAQERLKQLRKAIGLLPELRILGSRLLTWVLGDKLSLSKIAEIHFGGRRHRRLPLLDCLCRCLDIVAADLGITSNPEQKTGPRRRRDRFDGLARFAENPALHEAVQAARTWREEQRVDVRPNRDKPVLRHGGV